MRRLLPAVLAALLSVACGSPDAQRNASSEAPAAPTPRPVAPISASAPVSSAAAENAPRDQFGRPLPPGAVARMGTDLFGLNGFAAVAFSPDGARIVAAGYAFDLTLWDAHTARPLDNLMSTQGLGKSVGFFPDGKRVFVADESAVVAVDVATRAELWRWSVPISGAQTESAQLSADGAHLFWAGGIKECPIKMLNAETGKEERSFIGDVPLKNVAPSPDGKWIAAIGSDGKIRILDTASGRERRAIDTKESSLDVVAWSTDGKLIAAGGVRGNVTVFSADTGALSRTLAKEEGWVRALAFSPDARRIASVQEDRSGLRVFDLATGSVVFRRPASTQLHQIAFSPDSRRIAWWEIGDDRRYDELRVADLETGAMSADLDRHHGVVMGLAFMPDGKRLVSGSGDGTARLWDAATGASLALLKGYRSNGGIVNNFPIAVAPEGDVIATGSRDGIVRLWSADGSRALRSLYQTGKAKPAKQNGSEPWIHAVAFTPDGARLASAPNAGSVEIWDAKSGALVRTLSTGTMHAYGLDVSPDGRLIAATLEDGSIAIWSVGTGRRERTIPGGSRGWLPRVAFSPDGSRLAARGSGGLEILRTSDGSTEKIIPAEGVTAFAWSPDGNDIGISTRSRTRIHALATGAVTREVTDTEIWSVAFSRDGRLIATGGRDGTVLVWSLSPGP